MYYDNDELNAIIESNDEVAAWGYALERYRRINTLAGEIWNEIQDLRGATFGDGSEELGVPPCIFCVMKHRELNDDCYDCLWAEEFDVCEDLNSVWSRNIEDLDLAHEHIGNITKSTSAIVSKIKKLISLKMVKTKRME